MVAPLEAWRYPGDLDEMDVIVWSADDHIMMVVDEHGELIDYVEMLRGGLP